MYLRVFVKKRLLCTICSLPYIKSTKFRFYQTSIETSWLFVYTFDRDNSKEVSVGSCDFKNPLLQAMEKLVEQGLCKAIGISNFTIKKTNTLLETAKIIPACNQGTNPSVLGNKTSPRSYLFTSSTVRLPVYTAPKCSTQPIRYVKKNIKAHTSQRPKRPELIPVCVVRSKRKSIATSFPGSLIYPGNEVESIATSP